MYLNHYFEMKKAQKHKLAIKMYWEEKQGLCKKEIALKNNISLHELNKQLEKIHKEMFEPLKHNERFELIEETDYPPFNLWTK